MGSSKRQVEDSGKDTASFAAAGGSPEQLAGMFVSFIIR